MPKRKATGPVEGGDGDDEEYYSFNNAPGQSPLGRSSFPNNIHHLSASPPKLPNAGTPPLFSFGPSSTSTSTPKLGISTGPQTSASTSMPFFGLSSASSSSPMVGIGNTDSSSSGPGSAKKSKSSEFAKSVKDLNHAFLNSLKTSVKTNPSYSLIPMVKDYLYHSRVLMEQHTKGDSADLINGISRPPKSFKSLGEFFEEFEQNYVKKEETSDKTGDNTPPRSSALNKSDSLSTLSSSDNSVKSNNSTFIFNASKNLTPTAADTSKASGGSATTTPEPSAKFSFTSSPSVTPAPLPALRPLSTSSAGSSLGASPLKSSTPETSSSSISKPSIAPFAGFSFFTAPPPNNATGFGASTLPGPSTSTSAAEEKNEDGDDEDEEPPKVEVKQVTEDDAVYSIRCKVFGVVDGVCKDKGVGMMYVKKIEGGKYQIVVRADNNLGTVILNLLLQKSLPLDKKTKNSLMTVDPLGNNGKGMPIIIKVKTEDDATELYNKLQEFKQSASS